jgi:hypothetical protein
VSEPLSIELDPIVRSSGDTAEELKTQPSLIRGSSGPLQGHSHPFLSFLRFYDDDSDQELPCQGLTALLDCPALFLVLVIVASDVVNKNQHPSP